MTLALAASPASSPSTGLAARRGFITLDADAWAQIRTEYLAGATAKQIKAKWGCSTVSLYDHASKGGWTKKSRGAALSRCVLEETQAEREALAARASEPLPEASPLLAAGLLLRQAAAAALLGRSGAAFEGLKLAESLARCARMLSDAEHGIAGERAELLAEAKQALEDDPDYVPSGWENGEEARELQDTILKGLARRRLANGRKPPQHLPLWFMLDGHDHLRPLAEALGLVVAGQAWVECPDFGAAVEAARASGRGEAVDLALATPVPLELCTWLDADEKAAVAAREDAAWRLAEDAAAEVASRVGWPDDEPVEAWAPGDVESDGEAGPSIHGLHHADDPWRLMPRRRRGRIGEPALPISEDGSG